MLNFIRLCVVFAIKIILSLIIPTYSGWKVFGVVLSFLSFFFFRSHTCWIGWKAGRLNRNTLFEKKKTKFPALACLSGSTGTSEAPQNNLVNCFSSPFEPEPHPVCPNSRVSPSTGVTGLPLLNTADTQTGCAVWGMRVCADTGINSRMLEGLLLKLGGVKDVRDTRKGNQMNKPWILK